MVSNIADLKYDIVYNFSGNLNDNIKTYEQIGELYAHLIQKKNKKISVDFTKVNFISANLLAALGACLDYTIKNNGHEVYVNGLNKKIKDLMARNGFNRHFNFATKEDTFKKSIKYEIFKATTEQLTYFEKYMSIYIFEHKGIPSMSTEYRYRIIDNLLEIFNNVSDHVDSQNVYVCGQFFEKNKNLKFSIVDIGETFRDIIKEYFISKGQIPPQKCIEWAVQTGHSTKTDKPGGLGLSTLLEFLQYNRGSFTILSGSECYVYSIGGAQTRELHAGFPGTVVTIEIKLSDDNLYLYDDEKSETIIF